MTKLNTWECTCLVTPWQTRAKSTPNPSLYAFIIAADSAVSDMVASHRNL